MAKKKPITVEGNVAFAYLKEPDVYQGNSKYSVTLSLTEESQEYLKGLGVKLKEYTDKNGVKHIQREFKRKADFGIPPIFDSNAQSIDAGDIGYGDTVRLAISVGEGNALGRGTYMDAVKLLKKAERSEEAAQSMVAGDF
jgi:hypothetical protein